MTSSLGEASDAALIEQLAYELDLVADTLPALGTYEIIFHYLELALRERLRRMTLANGKLEQT